MKKYATFFIYFILLLVLCGCASSRFTETDHTEGQSITVADDTPMGEHMDTSVSTDTLHTTNAMITADAITAKDAISTTDQLIITQDDLELVEPVLGIGYRFDSILKNYKERILFDSNNCVAWKNSRGYMVACKTENGTGICALVQFSEDLELLEAIQSGDGSLID